MTPRMPRLIVFDLDYTLWPLWIDTHISSPLRISSHDTLVDRDGTELSFYPDVPSILTDLSRNESTSVGIASRTSAPDLARIALKSLLVDGSPAIQSFDTQAIEIYPGSKLTHFKALHKRTGIPYSEMLFFDDEKRNKEVSQLGVTFVLVPDGVTRSVFARGLEDWRRGTKLTTERP